MISIQYIPEALTGQNIVEQTLTQYFPTDVELSVNDIYNAKTLQYPYVFMTARAIGNDPLVMKPQDFVLAQFGSLMPLKREEIVSGTDNGDTNAYVRIFLVPEIPRTSAQITP